MAMERGNAQPRRPAPTRRAYLWLMLGALLGGCQSHKQPPSEQLARCLRDQSQLVAQVAGLEPRLQALATIKKERFIPPAKPTPIDPELAERFSQEDRELDEQRYENSLLVWEQMNAERYRLWLVDHTRRERALELDVERQAKALKQLNPTVVQTSPNRPGSLELNRQAVEKYSHCDPQAF